MNYKKYIMIVVTVLLVYASVTAGVIVARFLVEPLFEEGDPGVALDPPIGKKINILCVGTDSEDGNTDTLVLACIDPRNSRINLLSIPRDTRIKVGNSYQKINYAYPYAIATGRKKDEFLIQKIKEVTGLPVNYYAILNFAGFRELIDLLGGVEFDVPRNMYDNLTEQNLVINLKKGVQRLNGVQAEGLVRYRKTYIQGDIDRVHLQQSFILALMEQKLKPEYLSRANEIYGTLGKYVKSNITLEDISTIITSLKDIPSENMHAFMLPGYAPSTKEGQVSYYIHDTEEMNRLVETEFGYGSAAPDSGAVVSEEGETE